MRDENNLSVSGATVKLFGSLADYTAGTNQLATSVTSTNGVVLFNNLSAKKYYWLIEKGCRNNAYTTTTSVSNLVSNVKNTTTVAVIQTGAMYLQNNSTNPYAVYLNGTLVISSIAGGTNKTISVISAMAYTIRVLQLSGYAVYPTDKTYTGSVVCGGTLSVQFP